MQRLMRSELPIFCIKFRDYVRAKYRQELVLMEEVEEHGLPVTALYLPENSPHFEQIIKDYHIFIAEPMHERYEQASWQSGDTSPNRASYSLKDLWRFSRMDLNGLKNVKFTVFLTALCILIYLFGLLGWDEEIMEFSHYPAFINEDWQLWRYISHSLVHLSPLHILFNLTWWWIFAGAIERKFGTGKLIGLFFVAAIISGIGQNIASGPAFFGLSGVVYAVLGFVFCVDKFSSQTSFDLPLGFFNMLLVGIAFGFISPLIGINMGNTAHISGLIVGLLFGFLQAKK